MNPYTLLASRLDRKDAAELSARLKSWHDAMVTHERRLSTGASGDRCDDECAHAEAHALWAEARALFGTSANALHFLRSRGQPSGQRTVAAAAVSRQPAHEARV